MSMKKAAIKYIAKKGTKLDKRALETLMRRIKGKPEYANASKKDIREIAKRIIRRKK